MKLTKYCIDHWVFPPLFFALIGSIPLVMAAVLGFDGMTFAASLCFGLIGTVFGLMVHLLLRIILLRREASGNHDV